MEFKGEVSHRLWRGFVGIAKVVFPDSFLQVKRNSRSIV
jgi:hypothetical protein